MHFDCELLLADDILLVSASYCGLQKMDDICSNYGGRFDTPCNSTSSEIWIH